MQGITHLLSGAIVEKSFKKLKMPKTAFFILLVLCCIFFHMLLDVLANLTYHPAIVQANLFWLVYHLLIYSLFVFALIYFRSYIKGIVFALVPDLDWLLIALKAIKEPIIHSFFYKFFNLKYLIALIALFPNLRLEPWAIAIELVLIIIFLIIIFKSKI